jgi:hypothetical protein
MRVIPLFFVVLAGVLALSAPALGLPVFAHRYGYSCQVCHTTVPHLNAFGLTFRHNGYRIPGRRATPVFPIAAKVNLQYSSTHDPSGLPAAVLDELELLTGGHTGKNLSYFVEQYVIDGGRPGVTRDAWLALDNIVSVKLGQFTLPLADDPETERDTLAHYAAFDQTVGANPFNFFNQHIGMDVSIGSPSRSSLHVLALKGHDPLSGLRSEGVDRMAYAQTNTGSFLLSILRYDGRRPLGSVDDTFWRQTYGVTSRNGKVELDGLLSRGRDSSADGMGSVAGSSAGFAQVHFEFSSAIAAVARYEGTHDDLSGCRRAFTAALISRPARNMRFTLEGSFSRGSPTLTSALLFAY